MEKRIKNRAILLGGLFVVGLTLAGIGNALGAGTAFQGIAEEIRAVATGDQVTIYKGDKVVQNFTLQEGQEYTWNTSNGGISIGRMTKEQIEKGQAEHEKELNELLEVARKDSRVQKLIAGKNYNMTLASSIGRITSAGGEGRIGTENKMDKMDSAVLTIKVEDKYYKIEIDMNSETVKSIEEQASPAMTFCAGEGCNN